MIKWLSLVNRVRPGACLLTGAIVYALKAYYSNAGSESLAWVLGPTACLTQWLTGIPFHHEAGAGWLNLDHRIVIAPACSGVNFLIIAFCMSAFQGISRFSGAIRKTCWLVVSAMAAYGLTIVVNSVRIWWSVALCRADIYSHRLTPEMVHRMAGTAVYYLFLCLFYLLVSFLLRRIDKPAQQEQDPGYARRLLTCLVPLVWYLLFSLGVPFINQAHRLNPTGFREHALMVTGVSAGLTLLVPALRAGFGFMHRRLGWLPRPVLSGADKM